jgi:hypothetical protein
MKRTRCVRCLGQLVAAGQAQALAQIVRGQGPVVGELLIEETAELFAVG